MPGAGIEAGGRLVEKQNLRMMEQSFGELDAALHASGKSFHAIGAAVEQSDAGEDFVDSRFEFGAAQTVEVSLMPEVFVGGQLGVDTLGLEDNADVAAQGSGLADGVEAGDRGAARGRDHERRKNAEESSFAAAVGAEQPEEFSRANFKGNAVERGAVLIAMHQIANSNNGDRLAGARSRLGGGCDVDGG